MSKSGRERKDAARGRHSGSSRSRRRLALLVGAVALTAGGIAAILFWPGETGKTARAYAMAPESALPANVRRAPPNVREAYRFAIANRETLRWIPCFCGCGAEGHKSNADCYVKDIRPDGSITFDFMSLG